MSLNKLRDEAFAYAEKKGFHKSFDFARSLMLIVSELSEALEADRNDKICRNPPVVSHKGDCIGLLGVDAEVISPKLYEEFVKGTVEEEIADAIIRICDLAGIYKINIDWHVRAKMAYNETRPYKHGKKY